MCKSCNDDEGDGLFSSVFRQKIECEAGKGHIFVGVFSFLASMRNWASSSRDLENFGLFVVSMTSSCQIQGQFLRLGLKEFVGGGELLLRVMWSNCFLQICSPITIT